MTAWKACIGCAHYRPDYVDGDGDTYGGCALDDEIIAMLPAGTDHARRLGTSRVQTLERRGIEMSLTLEESRLREDSLRPKPTDPRDQKERT